MSRFARRGPLLFVARGRQRIVRLLRTHVTHSSPYLPPDTGGCGHAWCRSNLTLSAALWLTCAPESRRQLRAAGSEGICRTRKKVELEERGTPYPHLAESTAPIRPAEKCTIRVDRCEKAASFEAQREMGTHRHAQAECERYRKTRVFVSESRIRAEPRDPETAREIRLHALRLIERHGATDVQIFHVHTHGGEGISAQHRGLPTVEQLVLAGFLGTRIERERE